VADPVHILTQDADGGVIAASGKGLFTEYDDVLSKLARHPLLTIGGYRFKGFDWGDTASPRTQQLTELANEIDRAVRAAIASVFPEMLYPTEPNMLIKAQDQKHRDGVMDKGSETGLFGSGSSEGRTAKTNIRNSNTGSDTHPEPVAYEPSTSTTTSPVPERPERGLTAFEEDVPENRGKALDVVTKQGQNQLDPGRQGHELGMTAPAKTRPRVVKHILGRPEKLAKELLTDPRKEVNLEQEQANLTATGENVKATDEKVKDSKEAKEAVDTAVKVAMAVVKAMNSIEMRTLLEQLKTLLDKIYASRAERR
jgi:hypothetical protein